ncbi:hypothetical protein K3495_g13136 [Podosphaera aphanis]|nr:hypothetical protein K3495_g13136 [Podosphaera aphanis]
MKAMKSMSMNRMLGSIKRKPGASFESKPDGDDTPEANAVRNIRLFCESNNPSGSSGDEVLFLPIVVDACESSPSAAKEAAYLIRKFLSRENYNRPYSQYNSIMLLRILAENPGPTFTRNLDTKFVHTIKDLLRVGRDPNVRQILVDTLELFVTEKSHDEGLELLNQMWKKEQEKISKWQAQAGRYRMTETPRFAPAPQSSPQRIPNSQELSSRIEEARTSAALLAQVVESVSSSEILTDELAQELAQRCQISSNSMQSYISAVDPPPDNETMEKLIETNEKLSKAISAHQRAILKARKNGDKMSQMKAASESPAPSSKFPKETETSLFSNANPFSDSQRMETKNSVVAQNGFLTRAGQSVNRPESHSSVEEESHKNRSQPVYRY